MYVRPPEWRKNKEIWLAWPFDEKLWAEDLTKAQEEVTALCEAMKEEDLVLLFPDDEELKRHQARFRQKNISFKLISYADIWIRDTFPIMVLSEQEKALIKPTFNGWGHKYLFKDDADLSTRVIESFSYTSKKSSLVFEGGAIECDGAGTLLTTEQCLLNKNRNPHLNKDEIEQELKRLFGIKKVIWLKEGLINDHTDGHIDTIARFVGPNTVAIMVPNSKDDPNYQTLMAIKKNLEHETDANGNRLELLEVPSCGAVKNDCGDLMPASFLNFIIGDHVLATPIYNTPYDEKALRVLEAYSSLIVKGVRAKAILSGGGAFHCMSQEFYR